MVIWSIPAKEDLKKIHDYIAKDSNYYAKQVIDTIIAKADSLIDFPKMGREVPEIGDPDFREFPVYSYRLIYKCKDNSIEVLTIVHSRQIYSP
jgi:addiction module RelE/StbE family toxin